MEGLFVGMEGRVELGALSLPRHCLDGSTDRVAAEQDVADPGQPGCLEHLRLAVHVADGDLGARGDVAACLDDTVVPQGDAEARVRPDEAALADRDGLLAATGQGAHDPVSYTHLTLPTIY